MLKGHDSGLGLEGPGLGIGLRTLTTSLIRSTTKLQRMLSTGRWVLGIGWNCLMREWTWSLDIVSAGGDGDSRCSTASFHPLLSPSSASLTIRVCCVITSLTISYVTLYKLHSRGPPTVIWCPRSSICIINLPAFGLFHFCTGMDSLASGRVPVGTGMDSPVRTACWSTAIVASVLAYGHHAGLWPALVLLHGTNIRTNNGTKSLVKLINHCKVTSAVVNLHKSNISETIS